MFTKKSIPLIGTSIGKINKEEGSFVRVRYDAETLAKLKEEIKNGSLSVKDRLGIIRDLFALAEGGYIKTIETLDFAQVFKNETEFIVWSEIASGVNKIYNLISNETYKEIYSRYALTLFTPIATKMSWNKKEKEGHSIVFLRNLALSEAAFYGDKRIIKEAQKLFANMKNQMIPADIRSVVYNIVAKNGGNKEWKKFEKLYKEENLNEEKERYARAMGLFSDKNILTKTLKFSLSQSVKIQDAPFIITSVWQNIDGKDLTWKFIRKSWPIIIKKYGEGGHFLSSLLSPLGNHTKTKDLLDAKKFFAKNVAPGAERTLEQVYEKIESNASWLKDDKKSINIWLNKNF